MLSFVQVIVPENRLSSIVSEPDWVSPASPPIIIAEDSMEPEDKQFVIADVFVFAPIRPPACSAVVLMDPVNLEPVIVSEFVLTPTSPPVCAFAVSI